MAEIRWLGHSAFQIKIANKTILIDPWIKGNPTCPISLDDIGQVDLVCVTHDHADHMGDAIEICKRTGATLVGIHEISVYAEEQGVNAIGMNIGGTLHVDDVAITMVHAFHSCERGFPVGFVISAGGLGIYHAGDTGLFQDMQLIGRLYNPRVALLPIGGHYTMGPREAVEAAKLIKPEEVIPMHYASFPVLEKDPERFIQLMRQEAPEIRVIALKPGEIHRIEG